MFLMGTLRQSDWIRAEKAEKREVGIGQNLASVMWLQVRWVISRGGWNMTKARGKNETKVSHKERRGVKSKARGKDMGGTWQEGGVRGGIKGKYGRWAEMRGKDQGDWGGGWWWEICLCLGWEWHYLKFKNSLFILLCSKLQNGIWGAVLPCGLTLAIQAKVRKMGMGRRVKVVSNHEIQ